MKDGAYFINTSRGEVIDEQALINGLNSGKITCRNRCFVKHLLPKKENILIEYAKNHENLIITPI